MREQDRLLELIRERALQLGKVTLSSGESSDYYIDGKMIEVYSEGAWLIGEAIYERTKDLDIDAIGGLAEGAIPLVTSAVISYHHHGQAIEGFWVRDKAKSHGTRKLVEGKLTHRARVAIVDDVVTTGSSVEKAIDAVESLGAEVIAIITLVDRLRGARSKFEAQGYCYNPIFTIRDLGVQVDVPTEAEILA